ncbi:elongation of very long chain fatty acids protein 1 [Trichonephila clavata]|uniref:Elongation of very long chain fatty acids protein n=1 Tax=Trichonephila clavata TaxID=2740835 RepID=A0A8X6G2J0_TRICU|nr:elongation of very long chain fatty acids protein 1 [Trichonephila clavata]
MFPAASQLNDLTFLSDPRMAKYPLMKNVKTAAFCSAVYLLFVKVIGPAWMKNKSPFGLRKVMIYYNLFLVAVNAWITYKLLAYGWLNNYSWVCEPIDTSDDPVALELVFALWIFGMSKLIDYFDTVFFILRKKDSQINFLHVFHHSTVPVTAWFGVAYGPGGYNSIFPLCNAFVHIWMYLYYGLAAIGPGMQKYLWWKKHLTKLQLLQFTVMFFYFSFLWLFAPANCKTSPFLIWLSLGQAILYFGLFMHFYINSYRKKHPKDLKQNGAASEGSKSM